MDMNNNICMNIMQHNSRRIAHHEPICFPTRRDEIYTDYILNEYQKILSLLSWMGINSSDFLYGLDHIASVCDKVHKLRPQ